MIRIVALSVVLAAGWLSPALAQTNSGTASIVAAYSGPLCNKVVLSNGQTWAIGANDVNASARWSLLLNAAAYDKPVILTTSNDPTYPAIIGLMQPTTLCLSTAGMPVSLPNPATIAVVGYQ